MQSDSLNNEFTFITNKYGLHVKEGHMFKINLFRYLKSHEVKKNPHINVKKRGFLTSGFSCVKSSAILNRKQHSELFLIKVFPSKWQTKSLISNLQAIISGKH